MSIDHTDDRVRDDAKLILDQAQDAIREIDYWANYVSDYMTELCGLEDLPEDAEDLANDLDYEAADLADALDDRLERLRKVIAARTADDDGNEAVEADEDDDTD